MPPEIGADVREAAVRQGTSVSTWLTAAAAQRLRNDRLGAVLDAGALVAVDNRDRTVGAMLRVLHRDGVPVITS